MQVSGSSFLVTGASSGLGAACARQLIGAGAHVVLADINEPQGQALAAELGTRASFIRVDVTDESSVQAAVARAQALPGGLAGAMNCAGIISAARVVGKEGPHDLAAFSKVIQVNLIGTFNVLRLAAAAMATRTPNEEGERGVFIATASVAAYDGQMGQAAYAASKAGVAGMMLPAARDLARSGIRVMAIAPGIMDTPMMAGMTEQVRASLAAQVPFPPRLGRPSEFAALAQHIIENPLLNGEVIRLDGAIRMGPK